VRVAIVGAGRMGRRHIEVVRGLGLEVVGVADPNEAARATAATEYGLGSGQVWADGREMFAAVGAECVVVATTAPTHADYTVAAVDAGAKYVLCEKPMATSLADCDRMLRACDKAGARLAINHQMRFMEQYTVPKALVESESFGGLTSITVVAGNFGLAMNGSHYFEMLRYMSGQPASHLNAWLSDTPVPNPRGPQFEDRAGQVRAVTASGVRYYMDIGDDQGQGMHVVYGGRYGQLVVNELAGRMYLMERQQEHRLLPTTRYGMPWHDRAMEIAPADVLTPTRHVLEALLAGVNYPSGTDGRIAVAALVAAYLSNEQGHRAVSLEEAGRETGREFAWA
jgi:predicted dehydrogenase